MSALLVDGVDDVKDMPYPFFDAIRGALMVLSFDELPSEDRPPRRMWRDPERLAEWFDAVRARREAEMSGRPGEGSIEDPVDNEAASSLIVG